MSKEKAKPVDPEPKIEEERPVVTPDFMIIPRFGGKQEKLDLPEGSREMVQQYLQFERVEDGLSECMGWVQMAHKMISQSRKSFQYELMAKATEHKEMKTKKELEAEIRLKIETELNAKKLEVDSKKKPAAKKESRKKGKKDAEAPTK